MASLGQVLEKREDKCALKTVTLAIHGSAEAFITQ